MAHTAWGWGTAPCDLLLLLLQQNALAVVGGAVRLAASPSAAAEVMWVLVIIGSHDRMQGKIVSEELELMHPWLWPGGRAWRAEQTPALAGDTRVLPA